MKAKGSNAERELVEKFWENGWAALRIAGSGRMNHPSPDVLASNGRRILAIECKSTKHNYQYIEPEQIGQLLAFSRVFKAEPFVAIRFSAKWFFFKPDKLSKTESGLFVATKKMCENALSFSDLLK